eukprot:6195916-Pleurochrysis_carterae.AAC.4
MRYPEQGARAHHLSRSGSQPALAGMRIPNGSPGEARHLKLTCSNLVPRRIAAPAIMPRAASKL